MVNQKALNNLTPDDLIRQPCWKHFMVGDLEFFSPGDKEDVSEHDIDNYIVLTQFIHTIQMAIKSYTLDISSIAILCLADEQTALHLSKSKPRIIEPNFMKQRRYRQL